MRLFSAAAVAFFLILSFCSPAFSADAGEAKTVEGEITGQVICIFEWVKSPPYQGSKAVCPNANHDRSLVTEKGELYVLEPADDAGKEVINLVRTRAYERKNVVLEGEVLEKGPVKIMKVKKFKVIE